MNDYSGSLHVRAVLPEDLAFQFLSAKPKALSSSGFAALLIEQGLTGWVNYPRAVPVRETPGNSGTKAQPSSEVRQTSPEVQSSTQEQLKKNLSSVFLGDGVGRESEVTPRKDPSLVVPQARKPVEKRHRTDYAEEFQTWWKLYQSSPSRASNQSKPRAYEEWKVAKGGHGADQLLAALERNIADQKAKLKAQDFC